MNIQHYNKFLAAALVPAILWGVAQVGVTPDMPFEEAITVMLTALMVWLVPNKPK